jgi:hypothetical protein
LPASATLTASKNHVGGRYDFDFRYVL